MFVILLSHRSKPSKKGANKEHGEVKERKKARNCGGYNEPTLCLVVRGSVDTGGRLGQN